jgi:general secretion pathway protein H
MTKTSSIKPQAHAGFTLLELLVVLSIIMIAAGLLAPNLAITDNAAFNADVRRAASALTYARRMAIVKGSPQTARLVALDPADPDYEELQEEESAGVIAVSWDSENLQLSYQSDLELDPEPIDKLDVTFFPQGGSTGGLLAFSSDDRAAMIRIDAITGRIDTAYNGEELDDAQ